MLEFALLYLLTCCLGWKKKIADWCCYSHEYVLCVPNELLLAVVGRSTAASNAIEVDARQGVTVQRHGVFVVIVNSWACALRLENLVPVWVNPVLAKARLLVNPTVKVKADGLRVFLRSLRIQISIAEFVCANIFGTCAALEVLDVGLQAQCMVIKSWIFEAIAAAKGLTMDNLNSKFKQVHLELNAKEDGLLNLRNSKEKLEKETNALVSMNKDLTSKWDLALQKVKNLEDFVNMLILKFTELKNKSLIFLEKVVPLNSLYNSCFKMAKEEKNFAVKCAKNNSDLVQSQNVYITSAKNACYLVHEELTSKVAELHKELEFAIVHHAEECHLSEEKIPSLESEAEALISKKTKMELLITNLQNSQVLTGALSSRHHELVYIYDVNLVDEIWKDRPPPPTEPIVISMLDEIAWLVNFSDNDIPHSPIMYAYFFVELEDVKLIVVFCSF